MSDLSKLKTSDTDELKAQLDQIREDVRLLATMVGERATGKAEEIRGDAEARARELQAEARTLLERARARGEQTYDDAEGAIRQHPLLSIGIALVVGWVLGQAIRK